MHNIENCFAVLENAARHVYIRSRNKMAALGYVYTYIGEANCTNWDVTSAEFLEVQIPLRILVYDWDP